MINKNEELLKAEKRFQNHKAVLDILTSNGISQHFRGENPARTIMPSAL